ncbi:MAG: hypothetical protein FWC50_00090 [Planctomycetaceae bacterium]|nr:hypothetical protein [Planctomycetaceae bacterium]
MKWLPIGVSLFMATVSIEIFLAISSASVKYGLASIHYLWFVTIFLLLAWLFVPVYWRSKTMTMSEFLEKRYGNIPRWFYTVSTLFFYAGVRIPLILLAANCVIQCLFPQPLIPGVNNFLLCGTILIVLQAIITLMDGIRSIIHTQIFHAMLFLIALILIFAVGSEKFNGWTPMKKMVGEQPAILYVDSHESPALENAVKYSVEKTKHPEPWKPYHDASLPWLGFLLCMPVIGFWYCCTDQYVTQRLLTQLDQTEGRRGAVFACFLSFVAIVMIVLIGFMVYAQVVQALHSNEEIAQRLKQGEAIPVSELQKNNIDVSVLENPNAVVASMVKTLPPGLRGVAIAGVLAMLMSSLASLWHSGATMITFDIYNKLVAHSEKRSLVFSGRIAMTGMMVLTLFLVPVAAMNDWSEPENIFRMCAFFAPPFVAVFLLGRLFSRINTLGCTAGMIAGFSLGLFCAVISCFAQNVFAGGWMSHIGFSPTLLGTPDGKTLLGELATLHYSYLCAGLTVVCLLTTMIASFGAPAPNRERIMLLTLPTVSNEHKLITRESWTLTDVLVTIITAASFVLIFYLFSSAV